MTTTAETASNPRTVTEEPSYFGRTMLKCAAVIAVPTAVGLGIGWYNASSDTSRLHGLQAELSDAQHNLQPDSQAYDRFMKRLSPNCRAALRHYMIDGQYPALSPATAFQDLEQRNNYPCSSTATNLVGNARSLQANVMYDSGIIQDDPTKIRAAQADANSDSEIYIGGGIGFAAGALPVGLTLAFRRGED